MTRALAIAVIVVAVPLQAAAAPLEHDTRCVAEVVYHEARGEPFEGQLAVAAVVVNRTHDPRFPSSICAVVHQPHAFSSLHRQRSTIGDPAAWAWALTVARIALEDRDSDPTGGATFFDGATSRPPWLRAVVLLVVIGDHAFYREARH